MEDKRGQITIFVIVGIMIVIIMTVFFLMKSGIITQLQGGNFQGNPSTIIESKIQPKINEGKNKILENGGYINSSFYLELDNEKYSYLCYQKNYYYPCINQEPMLMKRADTELEKYIEGELNNAFNQFKKDLEKKNYEVGLSDMNYDITLAPKKIILDINRTIEIKKSEEALRFESFRIIIPSRIYDLIVVAEEILSQEARFCNFEQQGFMLLYPEFNIDRFRTGDGETIYSIEHRTTKEKIKFAVRGCVIPPGI